MNIEAHSWLYPFILGVTGGGPKLNAQRIIEALIIAGVVGVITLYGNNAILSTKIESVQASVDRIEEAQHLSQRDMLDHIQNGKH